jgi:hypothetical protein
MELILRQGKAPLRFLLCSVALLILLHPSLAQIQTASAAGSFDAAVDSLIKKVSPSVVQIVVTA